MMKKIIILILIVTLSLSLFLIYQSNKKEESVDKLIKELSINLSPKVTSKVKTTLFTKQKNVNQHVSSLRNILFYNQDYIVTQGGIIKGEFINRYFNATEFKDISFNQNTLLIGYKNGFLLLKDEFINHFVFDTIIKKCILESENLFCIKGKEIIKANSNSKDKLNKSFIEFYKGKNKINDILVKGDKLLILTNKELVIKKVNFDKSVSSKDIKLPIINANKLIKVKDKVLILSDREVFQLKDNIVSFQKISSIVNIILKDDKIFYLSMNGVIYNKDLKKEHLLNNLVNNVSYNGNTSYISTQNGIFEWSEELKKLNLSILKNDINENYITKFFKYNNDKILISYFNSGIDIFDKNTLEVKSFISNLNGVNDIFLKDNVFYIATTNGLFSFKNNKLKHFGKKEGIIGTSVSKIEWYKNNIFLGSEAGISKKSGELFNSIYGLHGLINNRVNCLKTLNSKLYVGTLGGISILDGLKVIKNLSNKDFRAKWITSLEAVNGLIYIATYGGGIYVEENNKIIEITDKRTRLFVNLNTFYNYKDKYLLAGTLKKGIWVYNIDKASSFFIDNLPSLNITAIEIIDDKVFIGSDFGFWNIPVKDIIR